MLLFFCLFLYYLNMRKLRLIFTLVFTVMFSSTSFADWTKVNEGVSGNTYYVDFERIRKHDGYVYFWMLKDFLKPNKYGSLSVLDYDKADCRLFRYKNIIQHQKSESMGEGTGQTFDTEDVKWTYPPPNTVIEFILKEVCSR